MLFAERSAQRKKSNFSTLRHIGLLLCLFAWRRPGVMSERERKGSLIILAPPRANQKGRGNHEDHSVCLKETRTTFEDELFGAWLLLEFFFTFYICKALFLSLP
jgi:hypothetical protein